MIVVSNMLRDMSICADCDNLTAKLSYEEAVTYFDFDTAASNWCTNFGMDPTVSLEEAKAAILHGTDRELVIRLATFARDVGYGDEKLIVTNAFRPACYQEVIGLHDSNANTGPFRRAPE